MNKNRVMAARHPAPPRAAPLLVMCLMAAASAAAPRAGGGSGAPVSTASPRAVPSTGGASAAAAVDAGAQHARLLRQGFIRVPGVLPRGEALAWRDVVLEASAAEAAECASCTLDAASSLGDERCFACDGTTVARTGGGAVRSFTRARRLHEFAPSLASLTHSRALARVAAAAMNVTRVRLYQATTFVKAPGDAPSAWHQDAAATPLHTDRMVTLWLALDDLPADAGALEFARGSHLPGVPPPSLRDLPLPRRLRAMTRWSDADVTNGTGLAIVPARAMAAGDATLHLGWTLHAARPNGSGRHRPAVAITYFADGARVHPELLRVESAGGGSGGVGGGGGGGEGGADDAGGVRLSTADGSTLVVRLLADDAGTWAAWLRARPPLLVPGAPARHDTLVPVVYDAADGDGDGGAASASVGARGDVDGARGG